MENIFSYKSNPVLWWLLYWAALANVYTFQNRQFKLEVKTEFRVIENLPDSLPPY